MSTQPRTLVLPGLRHHIAGHACPLIDMHLTWSPASALHLDVQFYLHRFRASGARWMIGRDLLAAGLDHPAGGADITVLPDLTARGGERVELILDNATRPPSSLTLPVPPLRDWLDATYLEVPAGTEPVTWTAELAGGAL